MKADLSQEVPEEIQDQVNELMKELGHDSLALPFYAYFPTDGHPPVVIGDGPLLQSTLIKNLENAIGGQASASSELGGLSSVTR